MSALESSSHPIRPEVHQDVHPEIDFTKPEHQLLSCPKCKHFISGKDINIEKTIAKCAKCEHVFGFEHDNDSARLKPVDLAPEGIEILKLKSELDIRLKWIDTTSKGGRWVLTLFAGLWNLIVLPIAVGAIVSGTWGILLFLSFNLLVGLGLLWHLGTIYLNRTLISVTRHKISIRTFPLKQFIWRNKDLDVSSLKQLYVTQYVQSTSNGEPNYAYALYAILTSGEKISLLRGMNRETQLYIEQEIENYVGIKNRKVPEEV